MCGIAGYITKTKIDISVLKSMVNALYHRGPDAEGFYYSESYNAGMRRLSINDLEYGNQPLYNEDRSVVLFYNGEIYNSPELRKQLEIKGHQFKTLSDGEVICHLYEEYGEKVFEKLDAMFAIALWDVKKKRLLLGRDIPGEKPLYYTELKGGGLAFASEIKSLIKFPLIELDLNYQALWDFLTFLWIPEPETVYSSIKSLPKSHYLIFDKKGFCLKKYNNIFTKDYDGMDEGEIVKEVREVVSLSIESRLLSDVPIASFLSSGLDSSIVSMHAAKHVDKLTTFTIGFENVFDPYHGSADESKQAAAFAKQIGSDHHVVRVTANDFKKDLRTFCFHGDQPFSVSSGLGIMSVARAARKKGIKILLSGDGADECFGGYSWYEYLNTPCANNQNKDELSWQYTSMDKEILASRLTSYGAHKRAWAWHYYASEQDKQFLFNKEKFENVQTSTRFFENFKQDQNWQAEDFIRQDREFYFPFEMLRKVDRMTMAFSVEGRVPFAAPSVLALADKIPYSMMVKGKTLKWVLRQAFKKDLPDTVFNQPKHGFNVPIDHWLKNEWKDLMEDTFSNSSKVTAMGMLTKKAKENAFVLLNDNNRICGHTIFSMIMLNMWLEENND
ncbi:MAG: asparagine synthase (glutamine-hydrolyzing) [Desulfobacterales bacterium]|nr:asparagine synthase (glutamine-hydrolyzing) [Desulfobacterales bacterium]